MAGIQKKKRGRPTATSELVIKKLEDAFLKGLSDREACVYAGISLQTLYNYCHKNQDFLERKELLKENLKMRAKLNLAEKIKNKDIDISLWYLERSCKAEFSTKQEVQYSGDAPSFKVDIKVMD